MATQPATLEQYDFAVADNADEPRSFVYRVADDAVVATFNVTDEGQAAAEQMAANLNASPEGTYRGWSISWGYGYYTATGPDYEPDFDDERGFFNGPGCELVTDRTYFGVCHEVDTWFEEHEGQFGVGA